MAKYRVVISSFSEVEGVPVFEGVIRNTVARKKGKPFVATQNKYGLFKVGGKLEDRGFTRGERISIARVCKQKFEESQVVQVNRELEPGTGVNINDVPIVPVKAQKLHPSGLPMNASISALKRAG
mgnify:CR=1|jgi:hypothetical protein